MVGHRFAISREMSIMSMEGTPSDVTILWALFSVISVFWIFG
jgi:hypothetical protein